MTRVVVAMLVAVLGLGTATACADSPVPAAGPAGTASVDASATPASQVPSGTVCDLIPVEAVSQFMGQPAQVDEGDQTQCIWLAQTDGIYQLHLQVYTARSFYAPAQWGTPEPIPGIGQEAFLVRQAVVGTVAGFWDGQHAVFLDYAKLVGSGATEDRADLLVLLLKFVDERL